MTLGCSTPWRGVERHHALCELLQWSSCLVLVFRVLSFPDLHNQLDNAPEFFCYDQFLELFDVCHARTTICQNCLRCADLPLQ